MVQTTQGTVESPRLQHIDKVDIHVPQEREEIVQKEIEEQIVEVPVLMKEEVVQVPKIVPQKRVTHRIAEQFVDVPMPLSQNEVLRVPIVSRQVCADQQTVKPIVEVPAPFVQEEIVHVPQFSLKEQSIMPQERVQTQNVEQIVDVQVAKKKEEVVHMPMIIPQEPSAQNAVVVDVPPPTTQEEIDVDKILREIQDMNESDVMFPLPDIGRCIHAPGEEASAAVVALRRRFLNSQFNFERVFAECVRRRLDSSSTSEVLDWLSRSSENERCSVLSGGS